MSLLLRVLLAIAGPIAALFVARDALNFGFIQMLVAVILVVAVVLIVALWPRKPKPDNSPPPTRT